MNYAAGYVEYPASPTREFPCEFCPLSFDRNYDLKRHVETHSGEKPYVCDRGCGKSFSRKDAVKRHQTTFPFCPPARGPPQSVPSAAQGYMHSPPPAACIWRPSIPSSLHNGGLPPYPTGNPSGQWAGPYYASADVSTMKYAASPTSPVSSFVPPPLYGGDYPASPKRPYPCDACPLSFDRHHDLKRHKTTHVGERPFVCNGGCEKSFTRRDALRRHQQLKECGH
ncbi:hypothetical protein MKEN_00419500 [Mycena kentingensis (nom. inval.)]|nr:hypothetical protein MKEN_00419500 [Mycena kentingensis (nom. inval.)]